jgi:hypothetical protein
VLNVGSCEIEVTVAWSRVEWCYYKVLLRDVNVEEQIAMAEGDRRHVRMVL